VRILRLSCFRSGSRRGIAIAVVTIAITLVAIAVALVAITLVAITLATITLATITLATTIAIPLVAITLATTIAIPLVAMVTIALGAGAAAWRRRDYVAVGPVSGKGVLIDSNLHIGVVL